MAYRYADYPSRSQRLTLAGRLFLDSLEDEDLDRSIAIQDLESAAQASSAPEEMQRFSPEINGQGSQTINRVESDDALSGVLLELQSANMLMAGGIALNEHGRGADLLLLSESIQQIETSGLAIATEMQETNKFAFTPAEGVKSPNLDAAKKTFFENAEGVLKDIVEDAASVINAVLEQFKKLDSAKILEGIQKIGDSFPAIAAAGRLVRLGMEKLKFAMDALAKIFGKDLLAGVKELVREIVEKFQSGQWTRDGLAWIFNIEGSEGRIAKILELSSLETGRVDAASNCLPAVSAKCKSTMRLLRNVVSAIVLAATIVGILHLVAPWLQLAFCVTYATVIAATILLGMNYAGSGRALIWVRGVGEIANGMMSVGER